MALYLFLISFSKKETLSFKILSTSSEQLLVFSGKFGEYFYALALLIIASSIR